MYVPFENTGRERKSKPRTRTKRKKLSLEEAIVLVLGQWPCDKKRVHKYTPVGEE